MAVQVVTDSSASLSEDVIAELGITVLDLHVVEKPAKDGSVERSTAGLSSLELAAVYGRLVERSQGDGVLVMHLPKELSSTWTSAQTAVGLFDDDEIRIIDSPAIAMAMGAAVMTAAKLAQQGADLDECQHAALGVLSRSATWVYLHRIDDLRRSGRLSATTAILSTALLATKPIMQFVDGKLELVGKTRTQAKAFNKLVELISQEAGGEPAFVAIQHSDAEDAADTLYDLLVEALAPGSSVMVQEMGEVLQIHVGSGAVGVSAVFTVGE
ncbi:DegV family protein [Corynebacterium sp.]|uniref:DegV family protein n=1 Tax=Corynebacterium sp. TaxID=1720 RepID=UPI0027B896EC|nr:DegV family protein [Corynebacterium sp.]